MGAFLEVEGVAHRYGAVQALDRVDLSVDRGAFLVLLGPNGAGKSTLLGILAGRMRPTQGRVYLDGERVGASLRARAITGYVSHASLLYPGLTAEENLVFYGRLHGLASPGERAAEVLDLMGLRDRAGDAVGSFSRGMEQRLAIARALLPDPKFLILDEPFSGLDYSSSRAFAQLLGSLKDGRRTFVMATHDLDSVGSLGSEVAVMSGGRVVHRGGIDGDLRTLYTDVLAGGGRI